MVSQRAQEIRRGVERLLMNLSWVPLGEVTLKNNRRVDVMGLGQDGSFVIVEVKSSIADFKSDRKWREYLEFADRYYFAVDRDFPQDVLPREEGLIVADEFGGAIIREAKQRPLATARRRALTLRFARTAALRLAEALADPDYLS